MRENRGTADEIEVVRREWKILLPCFDPPRRVEVAVFDVGFREVEIAVAGRDVLPALGPIDEGLAAIAADTIMVKMRSCALRFFLLVVLAPHTFGQELVQITDQLIWPLFVGHAGDQSRRLFIVQQTGQILILRDGFVLEEPFLDVSDQVAGTDREGGLLGLAFHPDFENNQRFFVYYYREPPRTTELVEYRVSDTNPDKAVPQGTTLLSIPQDFANHNGGTLSFGPDGYLYVSVGDGANNPTAAQNAQMTENLLGSILRLDIDSETLIPASNPFVNREGRDEIWAYGFRNPWRFSFDRTNGRLFVGDVGLNSVEEIDIVVKAGNYGWPIMEGSQCSPPPDGECDSTGLLLPIHDYPRSDGASVTGGHVYRGSRFPYLHGLYIFGDFIKGRIWALEEQSEGEWQRHFLLRRSDIRISSFGEDEDGELYVVDIRGGLFRFVLGDTDLDGVPDLQEEAGPNHGDVNLDGVADSEQSFVASVPTRQGDLLWLETDSSLSFVNVRKAANPVPDELPDDVSFPFGFFTLEVVGVAPGGSARIMLFHDLGNEINSYYRFSANGGGSEAWSGLGESGDARAEVGSHSLTLNFVDGGSGDDDGSSNGVITWRGAPAADHKAPSVSYLPMVIDGISGDYRFETAIHFLNLASDSELRAVFFDSSGSGMDLEVVGPGRTQVLETNLPGGGTATLRSTGAGSPPASEIQVGYSRVRAGPEVAVNQLLSSTQIDSGVELYATPITVLEPGLAFRVIVETTAESGLGLALLKPPENLSPVSAPTTDATLNLDLIDSAGNVVASSEMMVADGKQISKFLGEILGLPRDGFSGSLSVRSNLPVLVVALRQHNDPNLEFPDEVPFLTPFFPLIRR